MTPLLRHIFLTIDVAFGSVTYNRHRVTAVSVYHYSDVQFQRLLMTNNFYRVTAVSGN